MRTQFAIVAVYEKTFSVQLGRSTISRYFSRKNMARSIARLAKRGLSVIVLHAGRCVVAG